MVVIEEVSIDLFQLKLGGHNCFLKLENQSICKTYNEDEHKAYKYAPNQLRDYMGRFMGIAILKNFDQKESVQATVLRFQSPTASDSYLIDAEIYRNHALSPKITDQINGGYDCVNGSVLHHEEHHSCMSRILTTENGHKKYIMLEDLTDGYKNPCIMDMKIVGVSSIPSQYFNFTKMKKKFERLNGYEPKKPQFNLTGIRFYEYGQKTFRSLTKHDILKLPTDEADKYWKWFFTANPRTRDFLKDKFIDILNNLAEALSTISSFRLYYTSLLFIYDYQEEYSEQDPKCSVKLIDLSYSWFGRMEEDNIECQNVIDKDLSYLESLYRLIGSIKVL